MRQYAEHSPEFEDEHFANSRPYGPGELTEVARERLRHRAAANPVDSAAGRDPILRRYVIMPISGRRISHPDYPLVAIKLLHTAVWAGLAGSILALPAAAFTHHWGWVLSLTTFIVCECGVLALNRGRCPLTDWAARFTEKRAANFDIYLPNWLARNNKAIFGTLFAVNELIVLWRWMVQP